MQVLKISTIVKRQYLICIIFTILLMHCNCQITDLSKIHIQSRKFSAITGQQSKTKISPQKINYTIPFTRIFTRKPDIGLSIYNLQFDYNPQFSINVVQQVSTINNFQFYVTGRPSDSNIYNELYIMYIASDYDILGIYMPGQKNTTAKLGVPSFVANRSQEFTFNFKNIGSQPIFPATTNQSNIRVTAYLTGIVAFSQTTQNGYSKNSASFSLKVLTKNTRFYTIQINIHSTNGDILIKIIQFTVIYFDITKISNLYQMNSNIITINNFGGTFFKSSYSAILDSLEQNNLYQNKLQYFFGISQIQCSEGQSINLLAVQRFNYNTNGKLQNLVLTFETQRNTYIKNAVYQYIQYKPKTCNDSSSCGIPCGDPNQPSYRISNSVNRCAPCLYLCATCDNGYNCTKCPATRIISTSGICECINNTYFDNQITRQCQLCFSNNYCKTCSRKGVCQLCYNQYNFSFNNVLRVCQCSAGTYNSNNNNINGNISISTAYIQSICKACPKNCIYCQTPTKCQACTVQTYLSPNPQITSGQLSTCIPICQPLQKYNILLHKCQSYSGDIALFDTDGRFSYQWQYKNINNKLIINLLFSQPDITYYFYQNGKTYQYINTANQQLQRNNNGQANIYYDDGNGYINGYDTNRYNNINSYINYKINQQNSYIFDQSALKGQYYGLGQNKFYRDRYKQLQPKARYYNQFGIPFGKYQLSKTTIASSATFIDAIRNNLQFTINNQSIPYSIKALSGNQFQLTITPQKSLLTINASINFKNPALIRSGQTALQVSSSSKQLDRLDFYTQSQLLTASNLRDHTEIFVQILWGICKYILFIGFGWSVMPLMLILQYIFGHNYINSQLPLNLQYFLTSFADFRNPSILFNPFRNQFDRRVVNHAEIYKNVDAYNQFDRGIDFMKNSFQFYFVPFISFGLQFLLIGVNYLVNMLCKRDIPLISQFLKPRLGLHAAAYTLVQALPISFFFFGQLQDTRYGHPLSPNHIYPSFNTGMSYTSFFASAIIPLILLTSIYNYFKNKVRTGTFQFAKIKGNESTEQRTKDPAMIADPLWGADPLKTSSYGFGASVFYLPLIIGFFLSFFTKTYAWQLTGLLLSNVAFTSYAAASPSFLAKTPKFFLVAMGALMIAYQLVHAGVGSNRALSTYDQWNTGYLGIGILYALILVGVIFSGYLLYKLFQNLYKNFVNPYGCLPKQQLLQQNQKLPQQQQAQNRNQRDQVLGRRNRRQTTKMKTFIQMNPISEDRFLTTNKQPQNILIGTKILNNLQLYTQNFLYIGKGPTGKSRFRGEQSGRQFAFPAWSSTILLKNLPLLIDSNYKIYTKNKKQLGTAQYFLQQKSQSQISLNLGQNTRTQNFTDGQQFPSPIKTKTQNNLTNALHMIVSNNQSQKQSNLINIANHQYQYIYNEQQNNYILKNYNNQQEYKINIEQLAKIFIENNNKIKYQGQYYYLGTNRQEQISYYLVDINNMKNVYSVTRQNLYILLKQTTQPNQNRSILPSNKDIGIKTSNINISNNNNTNNNIHNNNNTNNNINAKNKINTNYIPPNCKILKLIGKNNDLTSYIYENIQNKQNYEIPTQWIDPSYNVYIDTQMKFWHKGQILGQQQTVLQSNILHHHNNNNTTKSINNYNQNNIQTNKQISSLSSITKNINKYQFYNIKFVSSNYHYEDNNTPNNANNGNNLDIIQIKQNIIGKNVSNVVENMKKVNPYVWVQIESVDQPSQRFILSSK